MRLYLVQHGKALSKDENTQRPLSDVGRQESEKIAAFLKQRDIAIDLIWHSKKLRAAQTAQIISVSITTQRIEERDDLNPLDPVDKFPQELLDLNKDIMIVGHLPFLQKLSSLLLTGTQDKEPVSFANSGVVCLEHKEEWNIYWDITPNKCIN